MTHSEDSSGEGSFPESSALDRGPTGNEARESKAPSPLSEFAHGQDLAEIAGDAVDTPFRHVMSCSMDMIFEATVPVIRQISRPQLTVSVAYNMKTNPLEPLLKRVKRSGFLVGCTSGMEQAKAISLGFSDQDVVLSGPAKFWPGEFRAPGVRALFCDSLDELRQLAEKVRGGENVAEYLGITVRFAEYESRLGVAVYLKDGFEGLCDLFVNLPPSQKLGLQFRAASAKIGIVPWTRLVRLFLEFAAHIGSRTGRAISCVSLGGGWFADDWFLALNGPLAEVSAWTVDHLPEVSFLILEAGKAFAQRSLSLVTRVLEVRRSPLHELIVDASIAELPDVDRFPHRLVWRSAMDQTWRGLGSGAGSVFGRLNLEADILARNILIPEELKVGDLLAFLDSGAYDASMSFSFGEGRALSGLARSIDAGS
jgi:diaminopimelate decarboxylase